MKHNRILELVALTLFIGVLVAIVDPTPTAGQPARARSHASASQPHRVHSL